MRTIASWYSFEVYSGSRLVDVELSETKNLRTRETGNEQWGNWYPITDFHWNPDFIAKLKATPEYQKTLSPNFTRYSDLIND